jgi:hypothetical protein
MEICTVVFMSNRLLIINNSIIFLQCDLIKNDTAETEDFFFNFTGSTE